MEDLYKILEVDKTASEQEIKAAYRRLAKKYHPDQNPNDKYAQEKFVKINEAYNILNNASKRANYDFGRTNNSNKVYEQNFQNAYEFYSRNQQQFYSASVTQISISSILLKLLIWYIIYRTFGTFIFIIFCLLPFILRNLNNNLK